MSDFFEEYGFVIITVVCMTFMLTAFRAGIGTDGFLGASIIDFVHSIIGGA